MAFSQEEQIIKNITNDFNNIRGNLSSFKKDTLVVFSLSLDGTEVTSYRDKNNDIRLLTLWFDGEFGKNYEEYYFKNDSLIYSFMQFYENDALDNTADTKTEEIDSAAADLKMNASNEDMFYFKDDKLIRWLKNKEYNVKPGSREFYSLERSLLENLKGILKEINGK